MIITNIVPIDKKRSKIYIDDEFAFVLYKGEFKEYGIVLDSELSETHYDAILNELLPKRAKLRGMALLTKKPYTEKQLRDKYADGFYPVEIVDEAIDYLKSFHYVDDVRYCMDYIDTYKDSRSIMRMKNDLMNKGISKDDIQNAFSNIEDSEEGLPNEFEQIRRLIEKKHINVDSLDYKEKQKLMASLMRKGYGFDILSRIIKSNEDSW